MPRGLLDLSLILMQKDGNTGSHYAKELLAVLQDRLASFPADFVLTALDALRMVVYCAPAYSDSVEFKPLASTMGHPVPTQYTDGSVVLAPLRAEIEVLDYSISLTDELREVR